VRDFWVSCGHHLVDRTPAGLAVTDGLLRAYLARPELMPPAEACAAECTLHAALLGEPRRPVSAEAIAAIADGDARENFSRMLAFRDHLLAHPTIEASYLALARQGMDKTPPLFLDQLVTLVLRNALDGVGDAFVLRAAELLFRPQRIGLYEGSLLAADEEWITGRNGVAVSPLVSMLGLPAPDTVEVLGPENAALYWERSDRFDFAFDLTPGRHGHAALGEVLVRFVAHMLDMAVEIEPLTELRDAKLAWYVGLDATATKIGDCLWRGEALDAAVQRILALYRLTFRDATRVLPQLAGEPVLLLLAMTADGKLRVKPQNLLTGLPIGPAECAA
jgi:hypothetical protein